MNFATELLHGIAPDKLTGSTTLPIYVLVKRNCNNEC